MNAIEEAQKIWLEMHSFHAVRSVRKLLCVKVVSNTIDNLTKLIKRLDLNCIDEEELKQELKDWIKVRTILKENY